MPPGTKRKDPEAENFYDLFVDLDAINGSLARQLVDSQFPQWSSMPINPVARQGVDNRTYRLGQDLSVRLLTGDWYAQQVAKEQRWLPRLVPLLPRASVQLSLPWSIYRWFDGTTAADTITNWIRIARSLGDFLAALHRVDPAGGPEPGPDNFFRGTPVTVYADETAAAIAALGTEIDRAAR